MLKIRFLLKISIFDSKISLNSDEEEIQFLQFWRFPNFQIQITTEIMRELMQKLCGNRSNFSELKNLILILGINEILRKKMLLNISTKSRIICRTMDKVAKILRFLANNLIFFLGEFFLIFGQKFKFLFLGKISNFDFWPKFRIFIFGQNFEF